MEALSILGISKASDSIFRRYTLPKNLIRPEEVRSSKWGIYADSQGEAKALAVVLKCRKEPEVHDSGYYGHYHDKNHKIHIWYGQIIYY